MKMLVFLLGLIYIFVIPFGIIAWLKKREENHAKGLQVAKDVTIWFIGLPVALLSGLMMYPEMSLPHKDYLDWTVATLAFGYGLVFSSIALWVAIIAHAARMYGGEEVNKYTFASMKLVSIVVNVGMLLFMTSASGKAIIDVMRGGDFIPRDTYMTMLLYAMLAVAYNVGYTAMWANMGRKKKVLA